MVQVVYPSEIVEGGYSETQLWDGNVDILNMDMRIVKGICYGLQSLEKSSDFKFTYIVSCNLFGPNDSFNEDTGHVIPSLISKFEKRFLAKIQKFLFGVMVQQLEISCLLSKWREL